MLCNRLRLVLPRPGFEVDAHTPGYKPDLLFLSLPYSGCLNQWLFGSKHFQLVDARIPGIILMGLSS